MLFLKRISFLILTQIFFSAYYFSQTPKQSVLTKKYAPLKLKEDATLLRDVVLAMHPGIGIYNSRKFYSTLFDEFIEILNDSLTEKQFRIKLKILLDELHCGHTEVLLSSAYYKASARQTYNFSPYFFMPLNEKVYMVASKNKKKDTLIKQGSEISSINGISVDSMLRYCKRFITTDGFIQTGKSHYMKLAFNSYYHALFGRPDTFRVEFITGNQTKKLSYAAFKTKTIPSLPIEPKPDSSYRHYKKAKMRFKYLDKENKTMHLKIEAFSRRKTTKAYRKIFRCLDKNNTQNLIIDLRNNGGGSIENCYNLLSYLLDTVQTQTLRTSFKEYPYKKYATKPIYFKLMRAGLKIISKKKTINDTDNFIYTIKPRKKHHYNNKLFVLINGASFSASCLVSAYLKASQKAVFVGEETSGAFEGCNAGIMPYYTLPNSKLKIRMPAFRVLNDVCPKITGHGIIPDYKIEYTFNDILQKRDLDLMKVNEIISGVK